MCNQATTDFVDNLQSLAVAITVAEDAEPEFGEWVIEVEKALVNKAAMAYLEDDKYLYRRFKMGWTAKYTAGTIDKRYEIFKPRLFRAKETP
jgi:hypothetical protein